MLQDTLNEKNPIAIDLSFVVQNTFFCLHRARSYSKQTQSMQYGKINFYVSHRRLVILIISKNQIVDV